jgi:hypothetical protein
MKRQRKQQKWYDRFVAYRILGMAVWSWIFILFSLICIVGAIFWIRISGLNTPPTSETFVAELSDKSSMLYANESGAYTIYYVRLKKDEEWFTCEVSSVLVRLWYRLEIGKNYEFSVNWTARGCYVYEATEIDETQPFEGSK